MMDLQQYGAAQHAGMYHHSHHHHHHHGGSPHMQLQHPGYHEMRRNASCKLRRRLPSYLHTHISVGYPASYTHTYTYITMRYDTAKRGEL